MNGRFRNCGQGQIFPMNSDISIILSPKLLWLVVSIHLKNMLVKMGSSSPRFGVKIAKMFETTTTKTSHYWANIHFGAILPNCRFLSETWMPFYKVTVGKFHRSDGPPFLGKKICPTLPETKITPET